MTHVNGIDVSDWNGLIDWPAVKAAGYSFAIAKATEGTANAQKTFARNLTGIRSAGMIAGAYHFFDWDLSPEAQASHFLGIYHPTKGDLPPALDLEAPGNQLPYDAATAVGRVSRWLRAVEAVSRRRCLIYFSASFWAEAMGNSDGFAGHPVWLAEYNADAEPTLPDNFPWSQPLIWQHADNAQVNGILGDVDWDWYNGDLAGLKSYAAIQADR